MRLKLKRICLKGYPCGGTCISVKKTCLVRNVKSQELLKLKEMIAKEKPVDAVPAGLKVRETSYGRQAIDRINEALNKVKSSWEKLPDKAQTQFNNLDDLYANARKAQDGFIDVMDRGTGLDKTLGGVSAVEDFAKAEKLMQQKGTVIIVAGIKRSFQSICFPSEWGPGVSIVFVEASSSFQSIYFPNEWGHTIKGLAWKEACKVSNQFISPTSGDQGIGLELSSVHRCFQSIYFPNEWGLPVNSNCSTREL
jgi:hypothetical protein